MDIKKKIFDTGGTPAYLAPEVIKAEGNVCYKSDVWSLGVLLYLLYYGIVPFKADDMQVLYNKIIVGHFSFPEEESPSEIEDLIRKMLVVDINERLSLGQVIKHPWFESIVNISIQEKDSIGITSFKAEALKLYLNELGFPKEYIEQSLEKKTFNHIRTCFELLASTTNL